MEMDIGMNPSANFNKFQSLVWGEAIRKSKGNGGSATFGAAAGFAPTKGGKGRGKQEAGEMSVDQGLARFQEAVNRDAVFQKQTLGGQILQDEAGNPNYMLGAFRGGKFCLFRIRLSFLSFPSSLLSSFLFSIPHPFNITHFARNRPPAPPSPQLA
jgi:DNA-directed RNA polymerase-3 subunit RPC5